MQETKPVQEGKVAWTPTEEYLSRSRLTAFTKEHGLKDYQELYKKSVKDPEWFWDAVMKDLQIAWYTPYTRVMDPSRGIPWTTWFPGGKTNLAYYSLDVHAQSSKRDKIACIWEGEDGAVRRLTYWDLYVQSNRLAHGLRELGLRKGDRVGLFMPMLPETVIATLAVAKIGAIFVPIFSGFGPQAVAARLQDSEASLLISADGFWRRGKIVPLKQSADAALDLSPTVKYHVVYKHTRQSHAGEDLPWNPKRDRDWEELVRGRPDEFPTEVMDPEDPYMLIYTSGTTGKPKGTVHVHCGFPVKGTQDMAYCFDLKKEDLLFWFTDMGWMMGPWEVAGAMTLGSTFFLYEGVPDYPSPDRIWKMVDEHLITVLGLSPTVIRALMRHGDQWVQQCSLRSLRILGSTGEPWNPEPWWWFFNNVGGGRCPIINYSGGTEVSGGILGCSPVQPLKPCSFAGPIPGMDVDVFNEKGKPVRGEVGELVVKNAWPGMTRGFWKDDRRYLETYWSRWPDIWVHGDWVLVDQDGFWFIEGRSDDTIKVAGKRIGPAEVESVLVSHPLVSEAAAIGVPDEVKGEAIVAFVILKPGGEPSETLREELKGLVAKELGKALKPHDIKYVSDFPKTRNAKIMRRVIRGKYLGLEDLGDLSSLENPQAVEEIARAK